MFKIDFPVTEDPLFPYLMKDLALLAKTGFKPVIVPGAKESIDEVLRQYGVSSDYAGAGHGCIEEEAVRITGAKAIPFVQMAAFHTATRFMTFLSGSRVDAVIGNFVRARGLGVVNGIDMEHTGTVDKIYSDSIRRVLNLGMVPILPCIGWSPSGKPYNVPSDEIALAVSSALGAAKMFIVSSNREVYKETFPLPEYIETRENGTPLRLTPQETEEVIAKISGTNTGREAERAKTLRELKLALKVSRAGIERVHIVDGREEGAVLKELFSNLGAGIMIHADAYESIRPLRNRDLPDILHLMEPLMQAGILIRRTAEQIQEKKTDYAVFEVDGSVRACGALHDWGEGQGEIAAVAADPFYTGMNLGRRIVGYFIDRAKKSGMNRVFVLTTTTHDWFESLGFSESSPDSLPKKKRPVYDNSRKSKVYALELEE